MKYLKLNLYVLDKMVILHHPDPAGFLRSCMARSFKPGPELGLILNIFLIASRRSPETSPKLDFILIHSILLDSASCTFSQPCPVFRRLISFLKPRPLTTSPLEPGPKDTYRGYLSCLWLRIEV